MPHVMTDRRSAPRYPLILSAEVSDKVSGAKLAGRTADISITGCYIDTLNPIPAGSAVRVRLQHENEFFEADARVIYVSPGLGMGLAFAPAAPPDQQAILDRWLQEVANAK
jgi:PilZ domain